LMNDVYPFTPAFGLAHNRPACVESAGQLFDKLAGAERQPGSTTNAGRRGVSWGSSLFPPKPSRG